MAIDVMKKVTLVCQVASIQRLVKSLHELGVVELIADSSGLEDEQGLLHRPETSTAESDKQLQKIGHILNTLDQFVPETVGFFEGLTPLPLIIESHELDEVLHDFDLDGVYEKILKLDESHRTAERALANLQGQLRELEPFSSLEISPGTINKLTRVRLAFGTLPARAYDQLTIGEQSSRALAGEVLSFSEPRQVVLAYLVEDEDSARRILADAGFDETPLPNTHDGVQERIHELHEDISAADERLRKIRAEIEAVGAQRRKLNILKAFWESNRRKSIARGQGVSGKWVQVLCGYVREDDLPALKNTLRREFPEVHLTVDNPSAEDDVPVHITLPRVFKPLQLLIDLFGRPTYGTFDPSPFIAFNFYLFFGICFGDVFYGLLLVVFSLYLMRKARKYEGVYNFASLFMYAGVSTIVFGALLGSWFGDLWDPKYLGDGNVLALLRNLFFAGLDPLAKPLPALMLALFIGMLNQFYGIALKVYGSARNRDWQGAVFDGVLWLVILPGLVITAIGATTSLPGIVAKFGVLMTVCGAIGLVLTQGREAPGLFGKVITGVVSLYGILGSYGITAFVGDTLSYCRLLALGVTTSVVAMAINIMAGMLREVPYVGFILFILVLILGHGFNFAISVLGAFVHSMRLIFVEFFGRFYDGGARRFQPLGFNTPEYVLKDEAKVR